MKEEGEGSGFALKQDMAFASDEGGSRGWIDYGCVESRKGVAFVRGTIFCGFAFGFEEAGAALALLHDEDSASAQLPTPKQMSGLSSSMRQNVLSDLKPITEYAFELEPNRWTGFLTQNQALNRFFNLEPSFEQAYELESVIEQASSTIQSLNRLLFNFEYQSLKAKGGGRLLIC